MNSKKTFRHVASILVASFFILIAFGSGDSDEVPTNPDGTPKTERQLLIEDQFSAWDGSHPGLEKLIKENMNDPSSYEHVETRYRDDGDYLFIITKFRGNNAFGGKVVNTISAKVDFQGNVIEIVSQ